MRIAIVGTGIAGNAAAYALATSTTHDITVYEQATRPGGHSATVDVNYDGKHLAVDTGFIVYNEMNYPHLTALFEHLGVRTQASDMSFAVSARGGRFEWCGRTYRVVDGLFAQRSNLLSPGYLSMLLEILRFNRMAVEDRQKGALAGFSLGDYLAHRKFSRRFRDDYLIPMGAAIWSMSASSMLAFPAESFVAFFQNHHLLQWNRPVWRTVEGGSRTYVKALTAPFADKIRFDTPVVGVRRDGGSVEVRDARGGCERFDHVILASHSDQSLAALDDASPAERAVLGAVGYRPNAVYLHRDTRLMPRRKRAWAAWNVIQEEDAGAPLCVTYWMNVLQNLDSACPLFVTLNPPEPPAPELTFGVFEYDHPQYDAAAIAAQAALPSIQGRAGTWFCGAWTGFGFHEDGLESGLRVAEALGARAPWRLDEPQLAEAAE
ncbi:FAD-dependent oxidoreductase [uncultured Alsobacter sp.]|uniref:NAD(P)/FAD-dependent oxidoreductase n=1 Tax=uncultured Alsobacter sp. TaxID=1748258 RepID=UPI0025FDB27A|nr:FAD-dependent oxidoreductase [uncultured Alsobacter sp.]